MLFLTIFKNIVLTSITDDGIIMAKWKDRLGDPAPLSENHSQSKSNIEDLSQPLEIRVKSDSGGFLCAFFKKGAASYEKTTMSVQEISAQMGISLPKAYEFVKKPGFSTIKVRTWILIPVYAFLE